MENGLKRFLSLAMAILLVFSNIPVSAFASEVETGCTHEVQTVNTKAATCTEDGEIITTCDGCGETLSTETITATDHNYVDGVCSACGEKDPNAPAAVNEEETPNENVPDEDEPVVVDEDASEPKITGVKVLVNGVEQPEDTVNFTEGDTVTVVYSGENFANLGSNKSYAYRIGAYSGPFSWFTIDTSVTPNTATKEYAADAVKSDTWKTVCYTNAGESETVSGYTLNYVEEDAPVVGEPKINGVKVLVDGVEKSAGEITFNASDNVTVVYSGENFETLGQNNQDYKRYVGTSSGNFTSFTIDTSVTPHTATKTYKGSELTSGIIGYANKGEAQVTVYTIKQPAVAVPKINGVTVKVNGVERPAGEITFNASDEVTVVYYGENFEKLGQNNQDYKRYVGTSSGNFYWFTIDTSVTPHTATKTYTGSSLKSGIIGYANKGEDQITVYTIKQPAVAVPKIEGVTVKVNGVEQTGDIVNFTDGDTVTFVYYGENFEKLGQNNQDYQYRIGPSSGNFYSFEIDTTGTPHTATKDFEASAVKHSESKNIGYTNKGETETVCYTLNYVKSVAKIGETKYESLKKAVEAAEPGQTITVIESHTVTDAVVIDKNITLDLGGCAITTAETAEGTYVDAFTILGDVIITGNGTVDARPSHGYTFYVGDKNGNAGTLTIENGTFYGETSVVNNRLGTVTINGGTFEVSLEKADSTYDYVLNCIDETYKAGTAKFIVKGGSFKGFNPADNKAETGGVNFVADGYISRENNGSYTVAEWDYTIYNKAELAMFRDMVNAGETFQGKTITLMATIDLAGENWIPIGNDTNYFCGTFDGGNKTISNMTINANTPGANQFAGLFGGVKKATIKNVVMTNVKIDVVGAKVRAAAVVGIAHSNSENRTDATINFENITVDGCTINAEAKSGSALVGGVVGYSYPANMSNIAVSNLTINAKAEGNEVRAAAINGYVCGQNISNNGNTRAPFTVKNFDVDNVSITADAYTVFAGGYAPYTYYGYITIENGTIDGLKIKVDAHEAFVGGLIGYFWRSDNGHTVNNVNITGIDFDVTTDYKGETRVGGMVGTSQSVVSYTDCSVAGTITERCSDSENPVNYHAKVGGFVGRAYTWAQSYTNCTADVDVTGSHVAGGFIGNHITNATYTNCEAKGDVKATIAGGFAGRLTENGFSTAVTFDNCDVSGNVEGTKNAGGFIGSTADYGWGAATGTPYGKAVTLKDCDITGNVTGEGEVAGIVSELTMKEGADFTLDNVTYVVEPPVLPENAAVKQYVAQIGTDRFPSLSEAVAAANAIEGGATIKLVDDVTLGEKLTITGNVTISGEKTITRADSYTGTLFTVNAGATLTLDGGLVVDGANEWKMDMEAYQADLESFTKIAAADSAKYFTPEEGAPVASAFMIDNKGGTVNLNQVTIQNNYSVSSGVVNASTANSTVNLNGAKITHVAATQGNGVAVKASGANINVVMNEGTVIDGNHVGGNHGIFMIYSGAVLTMNGGEVTNTTGWNSNGTVVGLYWGTFNMNGGKICSNTSLNGPSNGRCAAIYLHSGHTFKMTDGEICHNRGGSRGGIDASYSNGSASISGGYIGENSSYYVEQGYGASYPADVNLPTNGTATITGGTYTQDVTKWLDPDCGLVYDEETGTFGITKDLYEYNGNTYKTLAEVVAAIKNSGASARDVKVLASHKPSQTTVIDVPMTLDLNGMNLLGVTGVNPIIRVLADVTVTGNGMIDSANQGDGYCFIVGSTEAAGNLTIENGTFKGTTTAVSVTKGKLTILDGDFRVKPYTDESGNSTYDFLLNCIDANYKDGSAAIEVKGGVFTNFNPANNAAEGKETNFVAESHISEELTEGKWTVRAIDYVAQVGETKYESLKKAVEAAESGQTITVIASHEVTDSVVIDENITLDLNGKTITTAKTEAGTYVDAFTILGNVTITGNGTVDARPSHGYTFYTGDKEGNAGNLTIENGTFYGETTVVNNRLGTVTINGGTFEVSLEKADSTYDYVLNCIDENYNNGTAKFIVKGGSFYKFNPADNKAEGAGTNFLKAPYVADVENDVWTVYDYVQYIKDELLAGNDVTLTHDVIINDYSYVNALKLPSNTNGKYNETHGYGAVFHVIKPGVELDLNGHSIIWDAHDDAYCNKRQVSLFMVNITGNPGETADLTVKGNGSVDVYGMGTGMYVVGVDATGTIAGGTWTNYPCKTCGASNIFIYPSHGGELYITGGTFEQKDSEYLLGAKGSTKETTNNGVGTDFDETKVIITGGTFVNFDPENVKFFDNAGSSTAPETINGCDEGFASVNNGDGTYGVKPEIVVTFDDFTIVEGSELPEFTYTTNFSDVSEDGEMLVVGIPEVTVNGAGEYEITAEAYVFGSDKYAVKVVPGTLTVEAAMVRVYAANNAKVKYFTSLKDAMEYAVAQNDYVPIYLLGNVTLNETIVIADDRTNTMELQGVKLGGNTLTITSTFDGPMFKMESGMLNIKNLIIDAKGDAFYVTGGTLNLNYHSKNSQFIEVTSQTGNCVYVRGGNVNVNGAKLTSLGEYPAIQGNGGYEGNVTLTKWNIGDGTYPVVSAPKSDMAIYWPQDGKLTVEGGTITGDTALYAKSGTIVINGGEFIADGEKAPFAHNSSGATATGDAVVIEACVDAAYETPSVTITGGTFTSENANGLMFYDCSESADAAEIMEISGGTYTNRVSSTWCAEGYLPVFADKKNVTTWSVQEATAVAAIGEEKYAKIQHAINDAAAGDEIDLIANVENQPIYVNVDVILDLNGHSYIQNLDKQMIAYTKKGGANYINPNAATSDNKGMICVMGGSLTVKDSVGTGKIESTVGNIFAIAKPLTIENGIFRVGTVAKDSSLARIIASKNAYTLGTQVNINGGEFYTAEGGKPFDIGFAADNKNDAVSIEKAWFSESIQNWIDAKNETGFTYCQSDAKSTENVAGYLVTKGVLSVDGAWFGSWDDAESSIKKNSTIVLYGDVTNTYGGTVAKDFKFPGGGTITMDLNGHTFTSGMSEASKITTMTVLGNATLDIKDGIGGGKIVFENNSYPFVLAPKATLKIAEGISFTGAMQWNVTNGVAGNLYIGETAVVGQNGNFKPNAAARIVMNEGGDWTLSVGSLTMTADDDTLANNTLTINKDRAIDLAGHNLTAKNVAAFGNLIDSEDGAGSVKVSGEYYYTNHSNNDFFPLYDSANGCYRLYATTVKTRGVKVVNADTLKYGYTIYFNEADAYKFLAEMAGKNNFSMTVAWSGAESGFGYEFSDSMLLAFANKAYEQLTNNGKVTTSMNLNVNGLSELVAGDVINAVPALEAEIGVIVKGALHQYTVS